MCKALGSIPYTWVGGWVGGIKHAYVCLFSNADSCVLIQLCYTEAGGKNACGPTPKEGEVSVSRQCGDWLNDFIFAK